MSFNNDVLSTPKKAAYDEVVIYVSGPDAVGTTQPTMRTFSTVVKNTATGYIEFLKDAANGDSFIVKRPGRYSVSFGFEGGATRYTFILKNPDLSSVVAWESVNSSGATLTFDNYRRKPSIIAVGFNGAGAPGGANSQTKCKSGDSFRFWANGALSTIWARIEYLGEA